MARASGYMVQWEEVRKSKWEKCRAYYPSKDEAAASAEHFKSLHIKVRKVEKHALYKRA